MLGKYVQQLDADIVHFVAHSYGGVILLHYFQIFDTAKPGRVVMLGSPVTGSGVAKHLSKNNLLKNNMLGASSKSLLGEAPSWKGTRPLAVIAGTKGIGVGQMLGARLDKPNDGTVAVSETKLSNCTVHIQVPYSHTGLLLSKNVASLVDEFIRTGDCH
jgi:pimeloyl-ACP methyl ester carboxylesterase